MTTDDIKRLKASFGIFTKIKGSQVVLHYTQKWDHNIKLEIETSEIAQLRNLRFALEGGRLTDLSLDKPTLTLYLSGLLTYTLNSLEVKSIFQLGRGLSPEWEGLKLLLSLGKVRNPETPKYHYYQFAGKSDYSPQWRVLHQRLEKPHFAKAATLSTERNRLPSDLEQISGVSSNLLFLNTFKGLDELTDDLFEYLCTSDANATILVAFRATTDETTVVYNVFKERQKLLSIFPILEKLTESGWSAYYQYFPDLDRDFLLPFSGSYGFCVLLLSRQDIGSPPSGLAKFIPSKEQKTGLAPSQKALPMNYDSMLNNHIASFDIQHEPDWTTWCDMFNWNPQDMGLPK